MASSPIVRNAMTDRRNTGSRGSVASMHRAFTDIRKSFAASNPARVAPTSVAKNKTAGNASLVLVAASARRRITSLASSRAAARRSALSAV